MCLQFGGRTKVLEAEYRKNKKVTDEFINDFAERYNVALPSDIIFDFPMF